MVIADSIELYQEVAGQLLNRHYGITLTDIGLQDAVWVRELIDEEIQPFLAITSCVKEKGLARIDISDRDGASIAVPLILRDETMIRLSLNGLPSRKLDRAARTCFGM